MLFFTKIQQKPLISPKCTNTLSHDSGLSQTFQEKLLNVAMQIFKRTSQGVRHTLNFDCCTLQKKSSAEKKKKNLKNPPFCTNKNQFDWSCLLPPTQFKHVYLKQGGIVGPWLRFLVGRGCNDSHGFPKQQEALGRWQIKLSPRSHLMK